MCTSVTSREAGLSPTDPNEVLTTGGDQAVSVVRDLYPDVDVRAELDQFVHLVNVEEPVGARARASASRPRRPPEPCVLRPWQRLRVLPTAPVGTRWRCDSVPGVRESGLRQSPVYASPVYASPVYASPVYASPVYASPVYASPVYASPGLRQRPPHQQRTAGTAGRTDPRAEHRGADATSHGRTDRDRARHGSGRVAVQAGSPSRHDVDPCGIGDRRRRARRERRRPARSRGWSRDVHRRCGRPGRSGLRHQCASGPVDLR